jgi:hypothetical protein
MKSYFLFNAIHVLFTDRADLNNFARVDFGIWKPYLLSKLCFANLAVLADSKDIFVEHKVAVNLSN